jgi:hypothetical protein
MRALPRSAVPFAVLSFLAASCTASVPFQVTRNATVASPAGGGTWVGAVDLSQDGAIWSRRGQVDGISVHAVRASVLVVDPANRASSVTFALRFRPDGAPTDGGADLQVLGPADLAVVPGATVDAPGSSGLDRLLLEALRGSGRFEVVLSGSAAAPLAATVTLEVEGDALVGVLGR